MWQYEVRRVCFDGCSLDIGFNLVYSKDRILRQDGLISIEHCVLYLLARLFDGNVEKVETWSLILFFCWGFIYGQAQTTRITPQPCFCPACLADKPARNGSRVAAG